MFTCRPIQDQDDYQTEEHEQVFTALEFGLGLHAIRNTLKKNPLYFYKGTLTERGKDLKGFLDKLNVLEADHKAIHGTPLIPGIVEDSDWDNPAIGAGV